MSKVGRVLILGPALLIFWAAGCRRAPPTITQANPIIAEEVRLEGFDVLPAEARDDLAEELPLRAGMLLTEESEKAAGERAVEILQNHGRPYAQVGIAREPIDPARSEGLATAVAPNGTLHAYVVA